MSTMPAPSPRHRLSRAAAICALAALALVPGCRRGADGQPRAEERLGTVLLFKPAENPDQVVFLFSDAAGWSDALSASARAIAEPSALVVGVDLRQYLRGLAASDDGCHYLISEIEDLSGRLQREFAFDGYHSPILAGIGAGGTLAYAALTQTPAHTVAGAVSVDPTQVLGTVVPLCPGAPATPASGGGFSYGPGAGAELPGWWRLSAPQPLPAYLAPLVKDAPTATVDTAAGAPLDRLVALTRAAMAAERQASPDALGDLPLVELPADKPGTAMAVIYSGDGGWRDLDMQIGEVLAARGMPVVGVDSLRYFWREQTAEHTASDLALIMRHYGARWQTPKVVLIGYSFGAGVLPFAVNRLPADDRARVAMISLLGLEAKASFEIAITGWLGAEAEGPDVLPELLRISPDLVQCFYGEDEDETLCRAPELARTEIIHTEGGHHFDGDYAGLAQRILDGAKRRLGAP